MDLVNALRVGLQHPGDAIKGELARMVPLVLVGTIIGVTALVNLPRAGAMLALGVFVLLYAGYSLVRCVEGRADSCASLRTRGSAPASRYLCERHKDLD